MQRRDFLGSAALAAASCMIPRSGFAAERERTRPLFDGRSLRGWIDMENSATSFSSGDIADPIALAKSIAAQSTPTAAFLYASLDDTARAAIQSAASSPSPDLKAARSVLSKSLNRIIRGPAIYEKARFHAVALRPQTEKLLRHAAQGRELVEVNRLLLTDAFAADITAPAGGWTVKDGSLASTGAGRGVLCTARDFSRFRLMFTLRHVSGKPDHQPCVLIFCTRPTDDDIPLDALGGIQFQAPRGGHWDYRSGRNNAGNGEFTTINKVSFDPHEWSRVEIVADARTGTARMAVAQPLGARAVEVVDFKDPTAGRVGPIALQMHNAGLFDEYKELEITEDPRSMELVTSA